MSTGFYNKQKKNTPKTTCTCPFLLRHFAGGKIRCRQDAPVRRGLRFAWRRWPQLDLQLDHRAAVRLEIGDGNGEARHRDGHRGAGQARAAGTRWDRRPTVHS